MKNIILFLLIVLSLNFSAFSQSQNEEKYSQVRIMIKDVSDVERIEKVGLFLDHGINKPGLYFETWLSETEIQLLSNSGVPFQITIDDWASYYQERQRLNAISSDIIPIEGFDITHSIFGTMGGHFKMGRSDWKTGFHEAGISLPCISQMGYREFIRKQGNVDNESHKKSGFPHR